MSAITSTGEVLFSNDAGASWAVGSQLISAIPNTHFVEVKASDEIVQSYTPPPVEFLRNGINQTATATINVTYNGFTPEAQAAFQYAVSLWESWISSPVEINVNATYTPLNDGTLGSTAHGLIYNGFANQPIANTYYQVALAEKLYGGELNLSSDPDMNVSMNSNYGDGRWYFGTDGSPVSNQYDFVTTALHELCHGLGYTAGFSYDNGTGSWLYSLPNIFNRFLFNGNGQALVNTDLFPTPSTALGSQLTSNNIYWNSPSVSNAKIYAPATWAGGSSISHLDVATYSRGEQLMTSSGLRGVANHSPGIALNQLLDMGWGLESGTPTPIITINPNPLNFGDVLINSTMSQNITIENDGTADLRIFNAIISGTGFTLQRVTTPIVITAGGSLTIAVQFSPTATGSHTGTLTIRHNAIGSAAITTINLTGNGIQRLPIITVDPNPLNFGDVIINTSSTENITIQNSGTADLVISQATINGTGFTLQNAETPITIAAGGSLTIAVQFSPTAITNYTGTITLTHNADGSPTTINLTENGRAA
jgi:hypothetical protein